MPHHAARSNTTAAPPPANDQEAGFLDRVLGHFTSPSNPTHPGPEKSHAVALATSALPFMAMAARRVPVGLALLGVAAAGVALAHPATRGKIMAAGRDGLAALKR
jgi:hypothetical protein